MKSILPWVIVAGLSGKPDTVLAQQALAQQQEKQKIEMTDVFQEHSQNSIPLQKTDDDPKLDTLKWKKLIEISKSYNKKRIKPTPSWPKFYPEQITLDELEYFFEQVWTTLSDVDVSVVTALEDMVQNNKAHYHIFWEIIILYKLFNHDAKLEHIIKDLKRLDIAKGFFSVYFHEFQSLQWFKETNYREFINFIETRKQLTQLNADPQIELLCIANDPTLQYKDLYIKLYQASTTPIDLVTIKKIQEHTQDFPTTIERYLSIPNTISWLNDNQRTAFVTKWNEDILSEDKPDSLALNTLESTKEYQLLYNAIKSCNSIYVLWLGDAVKQKEYINSIIYQFIRAEMSYEETLTLIKSYWPNMMNYWYLNPWRLVNPDLRKSLKELGISSAEIDQFYYIFSLSNNKDTKWIELIERSLKKWRFLEIRNYLKTISFQYWSELLKTNNAHTRLFCTRLINNYYLEHALDKDIEIKDLQKLTEAYITTLIEESQLSTDPQKTKVIKVIPTLNDEDQKNEIWKNSPYYNEDLKIVHWTENTYQTWLIHSFDPHWQVKKHIESYYEEMIKDSSITLRIEITWHWSRRWSNQTGDYESYEFYDLLTMNHPEHLRKRINIIIVGCYSGSVLDWIDPKDITAGWIYTSSDKDILTWGKTISHSASRYSLLANNTKKHNENLHTLSRSLLESLPQGDLIQLNQAHIRYLQEDMPFIQWKDSPTIANNIALFMKEISLNSANFVMVGWKVLIDERN